jgi:hypothetical protein
MPGTLAGAFKPRVFRANRGRREDLFSAKGAVACQPAVHNENDASRSGGFQPADDSAPRA